MKQIVQNGILLAAVMLLVGCGSGFSADTDTVYVQKNGTVKGANVAAFDKEYYDETELSDFIADTVDTYVAQAGDGTVTIDDFSVSGDTAHVYLDYAGPEDYAAFNGVDFYAGTVLDAIADGYEIPDAFTAVNDSGKDGDAAWDDADNKIVIIGQQTQVKVDGTLLFVSSNVNVAGKNTADVTYDILDEDAVPAYIVYK